MLLDKKLFIKSLCKDWVLGFVGGFFLGAGCLLIFFSYRFGGIDEKIFFYPFGSIFGFIGGFILYALYSSTLYYYEKELIKKYGDYIEGRVLGVKIEVLDKEENIKVCFLDYEYRYDGITYKAQEIIDQEEVYINFISGQNIPLQIMTLKPEKSGLRIQKYKNMYKINK